MKKFLLIHFITFGVIQLHAQIVFQKSFGSPSPSNGMHIVQSADSSYLACGTTNGGPNANIYLVKTSPLGNVIWANTYGGNSSDIAASSETTADGGYIVCGLTNSYGLGFYSDAFLMKLDAGGNVAWAKTYGGNYGEEFFSVVQTADGGYVAAGYTDRLNNVNGDDIYVVRTNAIGDTLWTKSISMTYAETCNAIRLTSDGGFILTGTTATNGLNDAFLLKLDSIGIVQWAKSYGDGTSTIDGSQDVEQTPDGGYIFAGVTMSFGPNSDEGWLVKCDASGNVTWSKTYGRPNDEGFASIDLVNGGGYVMTGYTMTHVPNAAMLLRVDANGDTLWMQTYNDANATRGYDAIQTNDNGFALFGNISSPTYSFMFFAKTDALGHTGGCNEAPYTYTIGTPTLVVSNRSTTVSSGGVVGTVSPFNIPFNSDTDLCLTTPVQEMNRSNDVVKFYPNPFSTSTRIDVEEAGELIIYNVLGEMVLNIPVNAPYAILEKQMLQEGMYIWVLKSGDRILSTGKLVAE